MKYSFKYKNEREYKKQERYLRKYHVFTYKKLVFEIYSSLNKGEFIGDKINNKYEVILPTDEYYYKKYGSIKLIYEVNDNVILLDSIVVYDSSNDNNDDFKISLLSMLDNK